MIADRAPLWTPPGDHVKSMAASQNAAQATIVSGSRSRSKIETIESDEYDTAGTLAASVGSNGARDRPGGLMVQFENQYRQIKVKIVYYGPALGGKTTCLQHIHRVTDPQRRTRLYSLNTASDRTLFFDLLSLNLGRIRGYRLAIQLYTVPGQVQYNATRRTVLAGADGVVFVADSQRDQHEANLQSLANLKENLEANGIDPLSQPMVLQYNKRDLSDLESINELQVALNSGELPAFPTVAITGDGVMDAFAAITENTLVSLADRLGIDTTGHAVERLKQQTRAALEPFVTASIPIDTPDDIEITVPEHPPDETGPLPQETLISEAVRATWP